MQHVTLAIGSTPVKVVGPGRGGILIQADTANTADIYIGGAYVTADLTTTGGIRVAAGVSIPMAIEGDDPLWAVVASGTQYLRVVQGTDLDSGIDYGAG